MSGYHKTSHLVLIPVKTMYGPGRTITKAGIHVHILFQGPAIFEMAAHPQVQTFTFMQLDLDFQQYLFPVSNTLGRG